MTSPINTSAQSLAAQQYAAQPQYVAPSPYLQPVAGQQSAALLPAGGPTNQQIPTVFTPAAAQTPVANQQAGAVQPNGGLLSTVTHAVGTALSNTIEGIGSFFTDKADKDAAALAAAPVDANGNINQAALRASTKSQAVSDQWWEYIKNRDSKHDELIQALLRG